MMMIVPVPRWTQNSHWPSSNFITGHFLTLAGKESDGQVMKLITPPVVRDTFLEEFPIFAFLNEG
jgi:hypothetical protein